MKKQLLAGVWMIILLPQLVLAQRAPKPIINSTLTGKVINEVTKAPLAGAVIQIKGTTHEVISDGEGNFNFITGQKFPYTLIVSFVGFKTIEIIANGSPIEIALKEGHNQLNEVVVVGYGTQRRSQVTGAVSSVPKNILSQPAASFDNLLQGAVAGVVVNQSSGQPGGTSTIRIRGGNSLSFGNDPLFVIDGFIYYNDNNLANLAPASGTVPSVTGVSSNGLSTINPSDIESIDILKDASATAIYGSRGANGVVIITTKKGTKGSNNISYNGYYGVQEANKSLPVLNGQQWADLFDDLYAATPSIQAGLANNKKYIDSLAGTGANGDWPGAATQKGAIQNHQILLYGGDDKSRYSISGNYFDQKGIVLGTNFKRYSARINYERNFNKNFKIVTNVFGSNSSGKNKLTGTAYNNIGFGNAFSSLYLNNPLQTVKNPDGSYNTTAQPAINPTINIISGQQFSDNSIQGIESTINQTNLTRILGNLALEYRITGELVFKTTFGADLLNTKLNYYAPSYTNLGNNGGTITGSGSVGTIASSSWLNENTLNYDHDFNKKHFLSVLVGQTSQFQQSENTFSAGQTFPSDATTYHNLYNASINKVIGSGEAQTTRNSWLGRVSYSFLHRYNLTLAGRADGASPAGANKKWGFFPSAGFSWNASDEKFFDRLSKTVNSLKLRVSVGSVGNANFPAYSSLGTIVSSGYYLGTPLTATNGLAPSQLSNPDLSWETTTQYNAGLDLGLFANRISFTADAYYKKTTNLFVSGSGLVPLSSGYASVSQNIGSLENKGIELTLNADVIRSKDFAWKSTLIYAHNANKVLSLGPSQSFFPIAPTGQVSPVIVKVGSPVGTFWGYTTDGLLKTEDVYGGKPVPKLAGVSQVTGDRKYVDINGDGVVNTADKHDLGNAQPKFTAAFNNTVSYKNIDLSFSFQGSFGNKIFNLLQQQLEKTTTTQNVSTVLLDRWDSTANPNGKFPKVVNAPVVQVTDLYIEDGSYVRLKNITLGYNFPKGIASKILAKQIRVYVSVQNLLTITSYSGLDPEANFYDQNNLQPGIDYGVYPNYRTYTAGVNVTF